MSNHLTIQINGSLAALLHGSLIEASKIIIHQSTDHPILQNINQKTTPRLAELEDVVVDINPDGVLAGVGDLLDTGETTELLVAGLVLLAVVEVAGDIAVGQVEVLRASSLDGW